MSEATVCEPKSNTVNQKKWDLCFHCGSRGHEKVACPSKTESQSQAGKDASQAFSQEREVRCKVFLYQFFRFTI